MSDSGAASKATYLNLILLGKIGQIGIVFFINGSLQDPTDGGTLVPYKAI